MAYLAFLQERATLPELFNDHGVGLKNIQARKIFDNRQIAAGVIERRIGFQSVFQPHFIVFTTMARSGMNQTCAGIQCYMGPQDEH